MMNQYKLGVGPMSPEIIDAIVSYKNKDKLMVVASRNQVDYKDGYVCDPYQLALKIKPAGVFLCRDHCGPYFKDSDRDLPLEKAIAECKQTIYHDLKAGFDLIHIDISKTDDPKFIVAKELIDYAKSINPNVLFEFGSEANTGESISESISRLVPQLDFAKTIPAIKYFVSQTGSLVKDGQVGTFEIGPNTILAQTIHSYGLLFKEHNADYLTQKDITKRTLVGVDAMNVAPQLGFIQSFFTKLIAGGEDKAVAEKYQAFADLVYKGNLWRRWVTPGVDNIDDAVKFGGHYHFNSKEYRELVALFPVGKLYANVESSVHNLFDLYLGINSPSGEAL